ncbi:MAG: aldehyde dehydrogenase family protein, partial [Planctomycetes bacterium]|nr:aldehyde dehydrogenase family protein [Planctomycetota bacterium]
MNTRLPVLKTWKLFIGGAFPRTESGRTLAIDDLKGNLLAHICHGSKKDLRNAVAAARKAQGAWQKRSAYNRGQILYRMAEMLEGKADEAAQLLAATVPGGVRRARREVETACDRLVSMAGWADKYAQILGNQNPVAGAFYNFTVPEAVGVVGVVAPNEEPLLGLISLIAPALVSGNVGVAIGSPQHPLATALLGEVCATSDVPAGVLNLITGLRPELLGVLADHRDVDAIHAGGCSPKETRTLELGAAGNVKRVVVRKTKGSDWYDDRHCA